MSIAHELNQLHASVCKGLADPKRLLIINALRDGEMSVGEICEVLDLPQANVSQHLAIMRERARAAGCELCVHSCLGKGTSVVLDIPALQAREDAGT